MADTAAHLVDRVLPSAPYRQWVFTVPKPLRLVLARDPAWTRWIGALVVRAIGAWQRRVARKRGHLAPRTGAVTFVQRFGGLVNLNVHLRVPRHARAACRGTTPRRSDGPSDREASARTHPNVAALTHVSSSQRA
jgi:hypothetical protein